MSLRLTRKGMISSVSDLPEMRGLNAYLAGRRAFRDADGHGSGGGDENGGSGGNAEADDDTDDSDDADDEDDDDEDVKDTSKKSKADKDDEDPVVPQWKLDKVQKRMQAADQRASLLQKELDALKSSKDINADVKRELEETKASVAKVQKERDDVIQDRDNLRIKMAFMTTDAGVEWTDLDTALKLVDLSDVDISDDGKVDKRALKSAMRSLAKEKPFLLKPKSTKDADTGDGNENGGGASGNPMNGKRKGSKNAPDAEVLKTRFPALARINS